MTPLHVTVIVIVVVAALAVLRVVFALRRAATFDPQRDPPNIAEEAVKLAAQRGVELDYTRESIQRVDAILGEFHQQAAAGTLSEREFNEQSVRFGIYIGEVIRRQFGGHWSKDHEVAGENSYPFQWGDHVSFPLMWCMKRIANGDEDNVWVKYQLLTSEEHINAAFDELPGGEPGDE